MVTFDVVNVTAQIAQFAHFSPDDTVNSTPLVTTYGEFPKHKAPVCKGRIPVHKVNKTNL